MKYSLACCFLTHNHEDVVKEILDLSLKDYAEHQIDVCIYDDSDDDSTKKLIEEYQKSFSNLFYVDAHIAAGGDHKFLLILQGYGLPKQYDYIWPCKDRVTFNSVFLDRLCTVIDEGHDVILGVNECLRWNVGINTNKVVYTDPVLFYRYYAFFSTNWECLIRKSDTMLTDVDWDLYKLKYHVDGNNPFNQTVSLFVRLSELENVSIRICRYEMSERFISGKVSSGWLNKIFDLWIDRWVEANFQLPEIYNEHKIEAIKSETNLNELFGSTEQMIEWHAQGIFSNEVFKKYLKIWPYVTEIPLECLEMISKGMYQEAMEFTLDDFEKSIRNGNFVRACWLLSANHWFEEIFDKNTYKEYAALYNHYRIQNSQLGTDL